MGKLNNLKKQKNINLNFNTSSQTNRVTLIYKALYQLNDVILGLIFLIGSLLFFSSETVIAGTILFVIGSIQMTVRPLIALAHDLHLASYYKKHDQDL